MSYRIITGDCLDGLRTLPDRSVQTCITSPPYYGLRDYGHEGQIGLEDTPEAYVAKMVEVFREVRRVLRDDGTLWLNIGDSYAGSWGNYGGEQRGKGTQRQIVKGSKVKDQAERNGSFAPPAASGFKVNGIKPKDLIGIPWMLAFALRADGWYLRQDIIWHKPNPMPESVADRCTKAHEYLFMLTKSPRYYFDAEAVRERAVNTRKPGRKITDTRETYGVGGGNAGLNGLMARYHDGEMPTHRNRRSVWSITTKPFKGAHFAVMPEELVEPCVLAGSKAGDLVLDPFTGSGTVAVVSLRHDRAFVGCELNPVYVDIAERRIHDSAPLFATRNPGHL